MGLYIGNKVLEAQFCVSGVEEGYIVKYANGYEGWLPKEVFEATHQDVTEMSFEHALLMLKGGYRVARKGWNGKGLHVQLVDIVSVKGIENEFPMSPFFIIKVPDKPYNTWVPSVSDLLATDWVVVK